MIPQFGYILAPNNTPASNSYHARPPIVYAPPGYYENQFYRPLQPLPPPPILHNTWHRPPYWPQPLPLQGLHPNPPSIQPQPTPPAPPPAVQTQEKTQPVETHQQELDGIEPRKLDNEMFQRIRELNEMLQDMDEEFWEDCDELFNERLEILYKELTALQEGTHSVFKETLAEIESTREQAIEYAERLMDYELSLAREQFNKEIKILQEDYESERYNLHDTVLQAIEERRKLIKEDKEDVEIEEMFQSIHTRIASSKRSLRKRGYSSDRHIHSSRHERKRQSRIQTLYNIHAAQGLLEERDLESDLSRMKEK